jgi:hypothetical protein
MGADRRAGSFDRRSDRSDSYEHIVGKAPWPLRRLDILPANSLRDPTRGPGGRTSEHQDHEGPGGSCRTSTRPR